MNEVDNTLLGWALRFNQALTLDLFAACLDGFDDDLELNAFPFPVKSELDRINAERMAELCRRAELERVAMVWETISLTRAH